MSALSLISAPPPILTRSHNHQWRLAAKAGKMYQNEILGTQNHHQPKEVSAKVPLPLMFYQGVKFHLWPCSVCSSIWIMTSTSYNVILPRWHRTVRSGPGSLSRSFYTRQVAASSGWLAEIENPRFLVLGKNESRTGQWTHGQNAGRTDGRTDAHIEMQGRI